MAIKFNRSQTFATNGTVTAAGLHNLVDGLDVYQALITDQTNLTSVGTADELLIADADLTANDAPRAVTVQELFNDALTVGTYTDANFTANLTYGTATGNRTVSTSATITTGTINNATLGTTSGTAALFTSGTLTSGVILAGTFGTTTSTAATIPTLTIGTTTATAGTITSATIPTLTTGTTTGTDASFSGNVGIGTTTPTGNLDIYSASSLPVIIRGDTATSLTLSRADNTVNRANFNIRKARGSQSSPAAVNSGDGLGGIVFQAFGGTNNRNVASITSTVDTYTSDTDISSTIVFNTSSTGSAAATERLRIASQGQIGIGGANYGTSGQVLTSNGTGSAPSWQQVTSITSGTSVASTTGTAIDFTGIPSWAKRITLMFRGVSTSGTSIKQIQLGSSAGLATGTYVTFSNDLTTNAVSGASYTTGFGIRNGIAADLLHGTAVFTALDLANAIWTGVGLFNSNNNTSAQFSGSIQLAAILDRIRITTANGTDTFDAGSINIMYEG